MTVRTVLSAALLIVSTTAAAWEVPVHNSTYEAGPHPAGATIDCTFTNDDGQSFQGTVHTNSSGNLVCGGMVVPNTETEILQAALEEMDLEPSDCDAFAVDNDVYIDCEEPIELKEEAFAIRR